MSDRTNLIVGLAVPGATVFSGWITAWSMNRTQERRRQLQQQRHNDDATNRVIAVYKQGAQELTEQVERALRETQRVSEELIAVRHEAEAAAERARLLERKYNAAVSWIRDAVQRDGARLLPPVPDEMQPDLHV